MKVQKVAKNVLKGAAKTGFNALKLEAAIQSGDIAGGANAVLGISSGLLGKNNFVQRGANRADQRLSKYKAYRLGKDGLNIYRDVRGGNYTGLYKDSMNTAREIMGSRSGGLDRFDRQVQTRVLPTLQRAQDAYGLVKTIDSMPRAVEKLQSEGGIRNAYRVANKSRKIYNAIKK